jgi:hypothetical protein
MPCCSRRHGHLVGRLPSSPVAAQSVLWQRQATLMMLMGEGEQWRNGNELK